MNDEIPVDPIPAADVDGFLCYRDQRGAIIARCVACRIGFVVTNETAEAARGGYDHASECRTRSAPVVLVTMRILR